MQPTISFVLAVPALYHLPPCCTGSSRPKTLSLFPLYTFYDLHGTWIHFTTAAYNWHWIILFHFKPVSQRSPVNNIIRSNISSDDFKIVKATHTVFTLLLSFLALASSMPLHLPCSVTFLIPGELYFLFVNHILIITFQWSIVY